MAEQVKEVKKGKEKVKILKTVVKDAKRNKSA